MKAVKWRKFVFGLTEGGVDGDGGGWKGVGEKDKERNFMGYLFVVREAHLFYKLNVYVNKIAFKNLNASR